ncbi:hypothetical protein SASC598P14_014700 [Snodgrassella alvi SCGC AB-598-P14]|nr:hypothetical protein SASC598P14_014700 [Snodgrassella alvi SCGC AB-598-P14]
MVVLLKFYLLLYSNERIQVLRFLVQTRKLIKYIMVYSRQADTI